MSYVARFSGALFFVIWGTLLYFSSVENNGAENCALVPAPNSTSLEQQTWCSRADLAEGLRGSWVKVPLSEEFRSGRDYPFRTGSEFRWRFIPNNCRMAVYSNAMFVQDNRNLFNLGSSPANRLAKCFPKLKVNPSHANLTKGLQYLSWNAFDAPRKHPRIESYCGFVPSHLPAIKAGIKMSKPTSKDVLIGGWGDHWEGDRHRGKGRSWWLTFLQRVIDEVFLPFPGIVIYKSQAITKFSSSDGTYSENKTCSEPLDPSVQFWQLRDWNMLMQRCGDKCNKIYLLDMTTPTLTMPSAAYSGWKGGDCRHFETAQCSWMDFIATLLLAENTPI